MPSYYFYISSNSCGSSCELISGPSLSSCTARDNGCRASCSIDCGNNGCSNVCDSASCYSYCSGQCSSSCSATGFLRKIIKKS